ncbi:MAG: hypothetical protein WAO20_09455 [Acidobacteriota bacterium]
MRKSGFRSWILMSITAVLVLGVVSGFRARDDEKLTVDELIEKHLASIASPDRLAERHSFALKGQVIFRITIGGSGGSGGMAQIVSKDKAYNILFKFDSTAYQGEHFVTDGKKARALYSVTNQRNPMAEFLQSQRGLLTEGLFGGTLTTAWALLDVPGRKPRLKYRGIQEVDGRQLYELDYRVRHGNTDSKNRLYFEPETFRHVLSIYEVTIPAPMGANPTDSSRQRTSRFTLEERFAYFREFDGFTVPAAWTVEFSQLTGSGNLTMQWESRFTQSAVNMQVPPNLFQVD